MLERSLNEVSAMVRKAARGLGASWSIGDEISWATRRLCILGLPGCAAVDAYFGVFQAHGAQGHGPMTLTNSWQSERPPMCPVQTGSALADNPDALPGKILALRDLASPLLILPFVALAAQSRNEVLQLKWGETAVVTDGAHVSYSGPLDHRISQVSLTRDGQVGVPPVLHTRVRVDVAIWSRLEALAGLTYAPATDESRARGAGAQD